jgi:transposase
MSIIKEVTEIKPYSTKELSQIYGVSERTMLKWMKPFAEEVGKKHGRFYTVLQVEKIFQRLGVPYRIKE